MYMASPCGLGYVTLSQCNVWVPRAYVLKKSHVLKKSQMDAVLSVFFSLGSQSLKLQLTLEQQFTS